MEEQKISKDRLDVIEKIKNYEMLGGDNFFNDVENDPPIKTLMPEDVDYLKKKFSSKFKNFWANTIIRFGIGGVIKKHKLEIKGIENLKKVKGGAVITSNHYYYFDAAPLVYALKKTKNKHKLNIIIREGNYQIPGFFGFLLKNYNTLPLSSNLKTTMNLNKAIDVVLQKGQYLLVYPEQAMWWNYRKPRKYKMGAFRWASKNNVPIIPCFTTMEDLPEREENGLPIQKLTFHIGEPIYPDPNLSTKENAEVMLIKNHDFTIGVYEKTYNTNYDLNID